MSRRIVFAGTSAFAAYILRRLLEQQAQYGGKLFSSTIQNCQTFVSNDSLPLTDNWSVVAVYSQTDKPYGRGQKIINTPVKEVALEFGLPVYQPISLKNDASYEVFKELEPDLFIVVAYGKIIPQSWLDLPVYGAINIHASLLPRWRGAAPIQRALQFGDKKTGIAVMKMDAGLDTGPVLRMQSLPIDDNDNTISLSSKLSELGFDELISVLSDLKFYLSQAQKQSENDVSYANKLSKDEAKINWNDSANSIHNHIRAFNPNPGAYSYLHGNLVKIWQSTVVKDFAQSYKNLNPGTVYFLDKHNLLIATGNDLLAISELQIAGGKRLNISQFLNGQGKNIIVGETLFS